MLTIFVVLNHVRGGLPPFHPMNTTVKSTASFIMNAAPSAVSGYLDRVHRSASPTVSIDNLASRYFGTSDPKFDQYVRKWLISAVAQAAMPGRGNTRCLYLHGDAFGKNNFFGILGGDFFDWTPFHTLNDYGRRLVTHSSWIYLLSMDELPSDVEWEVCNAWLKCDSDVFFNRAYPEKLSERYGRPFVVGAISSHHKFKSNDHLLSHRLFWKIPVMAENLPWGGQWINQELLERERDGIWASSVDAYLKDEQWW